MAKTPREGDLPADLPAGWDDNPEWAEDNTRPLDAAGRLKVARLALGMTQAEAAELLGVPLGTLRGWEQRRFEPDPPAKTLIRLFHDHPVELRAWLSAA